MINIEENLAGLIEDRDFRFLHQKLRRFNLFDALGAVRGELRHSNFLGFLLSPARSHGIGSELLRQFIRTALVKLPNERRPIRPLQLITSDLGNAILYRERDSIDLLIELKAIRLVVLVENKIDSAVGLGQLARYKRIVQASYPEFKHLFVLLTPEGVGPDEDDYVSLSYSEIADLVDKIVNDEGQPISKELTLILRHYVDMLRRHIVQDDELVNLARQIYERHKEAIDYIIENRPQSDNLLEVIRPLLDSDPGFAPDKHIATILRFVPKEWQEVPTFNASPTAEWTRSGRTLLFEVKANRETNRISVALVLGPADHALRANIYDHCAQHPKIFVNLVKPMGAKYATVFTRDLLSGKAAETMNADERVTTLKNAWRQFLDNDLALLKAELAKIPSRRDSF